MRILAIEPYFGGSHKAFIDGWQAHSEHEWTLVSLPAHKWKWRMRHAPLSCSEIIHKLYQEGKRWDVCFASDMLNVAELSGMLPPEVAALPRIVYFHENQLTYPVRGDEKRDYHYAYTNFISCAASDEVWFNTAWHREVFLHGLEAYLRRMPDYSHIDTIDNIRQKSRVMPQGIYPPPKRPERKDGPMRLVWAARWEHDKNPGDFYGALKLLREKHIPFEISVIGESFKKQPKVFDLIKDEFGSVINYWGYQQTSEEYYRALSEADIAISTAQHEFFGISLMEAASCGTVPLAPERLAYPEVLRGNGDFLYDNTARALCENLQDLESKLHTSQWQELSDLAKEISHRFFWQKITPKLDQGITSACNAKATDNCACPTA